MERYPANDFDDPDKLLATLGSFWANTYAGGYAVESLAYARAQLDAQAHLDLLELVAAVSRLTVPVFHTDNWYFLQLTESELNSTDLPAYDGTLRYGDGQARYGVPLPSTLFAWPAPADLVDGSAVLNRITDSSLSLFRGVDFDLKPGVIVFRSNPFASDLVSIRDVTDGSVVVDRQAGLWVYRGRFDRDAVYRQFGYVLGLKLRSSEGYRDLVNAVFDALVTGTSGAETDRVFAAVAGVPLARTAEVVESILYDGRHRWVVTPTQAYEHPPAATLTVAAGDTLVPGQSMSDAFEVIELNRADPANPPDIHAVAVGPGLLGFGYFQDLVFENKTVPLVVEDTPSGYTKVSFEVGGVPADVKQFWADVHARGVAANQTLAMLLDRRPAAARGTQPTAAALPATVNPLGFVLANLFRNNAFVVKFQTASFGKAALGLHNLSVLRRIVPPGTACIVLVTLAVSDDPIILDAPGDDLRAGYTEGAKSFVGKAVLEAIDYTMITEKARTRQMTGHCE